MNMLVDPRDVGEVDMMVLAVARRILGQLEAIALDFVNAADALPIGSDDVHVLAD
jgi:hypothetical protein